MKWKEIDGYNGMYLVSDNGLVYSKHINDQLCQQRDKDGYLWVGLHKNGKKKKIFVHTLVLETFVGPRPGDMYCRHYPDQNKENNNISNLSWCSSKTNARDRQLLGHTNTVLAEKDVVEIKENLLCGKTQADMHRKYNVSRDTIHKIATGKTWSDIGPKLDNSVIDKRKSLSELTVSQIKQAIVDGYNTPTMEHNFGATKDQIYKIKDKKQWIDVDPCGSDNLPKLKIIPMFKGKFDYSQILAIRSMIDNSEKTVSELSKHYDVDYKTIYNIWKRKSYKHVK